MTTDIRADTIDFDNEPRCAFCDALIRGDQKYCGPCWSRLFDAKRAAYGAAEPDAASCALCGGVRACDSRWGTPICYACHARIYPISLRCGQVDAPPRYTDWQPGRWNGRAVSHMQHQRDPKEPPRRPWHAELLALLGRLDVAWE